MQPTLQQNVGTPATSAQKIVPLLQALNRAEDNAAALALRLDPIVNHVPSPSAGDLPISPTVTNRLNSLGDTLQYLLDNIEL